MKRTLTIEAVDNIGKEIQFCGWVASRRDHGKIIFIDLRDRWGTIQVVFTPEKKEVYETAQKLRPEWVIEIIGEMKQRPKGMENEKSPTGAVEVEAKEIKTLSGAETIPFSISGHGYDTSEEKRLKHRFIDLRRVRLQKNLSQRQKIIHFMRNYFIERDFIEIETPILTKSTPEGARDFLVSSRLQPGKFYALPQSPQQFKQILMAAGIEKYFQIARCFRDEDPRADRQAEFTQLDLEESFAEEKDIMDIIENLFIELAGKLYPNKKIKEIPFPLLTYQEAMEKHQTDKPDLRNDKKNSDELAFAWITGFPFFEKNEEKKWTFTHNPFSAPKPEFMENLLAKKNIEKILTTQYDIVLNGWEIGGGSIRNHRPEALQAVFEILGYKKSEIKENFGHFLEIFKYGLPPHAGIALGLDRFIMIAQNEPSIREIIAFPKTGDGRDLMMEAPSSVSKKQLMELSLAIKTKKTKKKI